MCDVHPPARRKTVYVLHVHMNKHSFLSTRKFTPERVKCVNKTCLRVNIVYCVCRVLKKIDKNGCCFSACVYKRCRHLYTIVIKMRELLYDDEVLEAKKNYYMTIREHFSPHNHHHRIGGKNVCACCCRAHHNKQPLSHFICWFPFFVRRLRLVSLGFFSYVPVYLYYIVMNSYEFSDYYYSSLLWEKICTLMRNNFLE